MSIQQHTIDTPYMVGPVHCYSAEVKGELVLFDCGPPTDKAKQYLKDNIDLAKLRYVFITHCHIDHYGLLHWLEMETNAEIFIPYRDGLKILSHDARLADMYGLLERLGFGGKYLADLHAALSNGRIFPPFPKKFSIIEDDMPEHLGLIFYCCPGHSQSDIVFANDDWAVTGDVLLKGVFQSPLLDVDLETGERFNNYQAYCSTIRKLAELRGKKICPAHRKDIEDVDETILFYVSKMFDRARQLHGLQMNEKVAEVITHLFGDSLQEPFHIYLKASEILFLQDFLNDPQRLQNSLKSIQLFDQVAEKYDRAVST